LAIKFVFSISLTDKNYLWGHCCK